MTIMGNVTVHLRSTLEKKGIPKRRDRKDAYFNWYAEAYKSLHDSKIASLNDSLQKSNVKLKTQYVPKTKYEGLR